MILQVISNDLLASYLLSGSLVFKILININKLLIYVEMLERFVLYTHFIYYISRE